MRFRHPGNCVFDRLEKYPEVIKLSGARDVIRHVARDNYRAV